MGRARGFVRTQDAMSGHAEFGRRGGTTVEGYVRVERCAGRTCSYGAELGGVETRLYLRCPLHKVHVAAEG